jgi:acetyl-CoA synthetase
MQHEIALSTHLSESRQFSPSTQFSATARVDAHAYAELKKQGDEDPERFWQEAAEQLVWQRRWDSVLEWNPPRAKWFVGGKLNVTETCLDQHILGPRRNKRAIVWEGEGGEVREITYAELHMQVCELASVLIKRGVKAGDRVAIYMPLVPEAAMAMLACARIGAIHSVIFGGFSAESIRDRVRNAGCVMIITADGGYRKGSVVELKRTVDEALTDDACPTVKSVMVYARTHMPVKMTSGRDAWWHEEVCSLAQGEKVLEATALDSEHPLFILYTSGTTGKPKGIVHSTGGYLTQVAATTSWVFDLKEDDVYWCTADVGWITGHSYVVYGPLANGATVFLYEGAPTHPGPDRFWSMIAKHKISILYTAPTAIRLFMRLGEEHVRKHDLSSLRLLGTVGEPINPEAWMWYHDKVGLGRCPIVDTWWQTETGAIMIAPLPGAVMTTPGSATQPIPGIAMDVVDQSGVSVGTSSGGYLIARKPWPSMARGIWGDDERFAATYFSQMPGNYFTGDGARVDDNGNFWIMGRIDDVVNVSGHRIGTMEVESALVSHAGVAEAAVVARPDELTGQAIVAFVTLRDDFEADAHTEKALMQTVSKQIGAFARPASIRFTKSLPKTRSGKIMRRLLRELATQGRVTGDVTTLEDFGAIAALSAEA